MIYIYNKYGELVNKCSSIEEAVTYVMDKGISKGRFVEVEKRIEKAISYKLIYLNLIFSNTTNISEYKSINDYVSFIKVGDVLGENEYEVVNIELYGGGAKRYWTKCKKCGNIKSTDYKGVVYITKCNNCSLNNFRLSEDKTYWIGTTQNGFDFYFTKDNEVDNYIKSKTWRKNAQGYFQNSNGEKLHRVVMGATDPNVYINHIGGNKYDCRKNMLSISNCLDNSKEKKVSKRNNSGMVGLMKRRNKYVGCIKINDLSIYSTYKTKEEAIIDLLIMQKHYGFRHNEKMYYILNSIPKDRYNEVISNCERQLESNRNHKIKSKNKIEISTCGTFCWVYDVDEKKKNNKFKVSIQNIDIIKEGIWNIACNEGKYYVNGSIIINGKRKTVKLHRLLMGLLDVKYKRWFIDHINGDSLDNRDENLIITDASGNGHKSNSKGYYERTDSPKVYRARGLLNGEKYDKTFYNELEAIDFVNKKREEFFKTRIQFKNKEDLDTYILKINKKDR